MRHQVSLSKLPIIEQVYPLSLTLQFHCLIINCFHTIGFQSTRDYSCTCKHISRDILRIYPAICKNSNICKFINKCYLQNKHFIHVLYTVNKSIGLRLMISLFHGIHQKIFLRVSFDREGQVLYNSKFCHCQCHLHFCDYGNFIA